MMKAVMMSNVSNDVIKGFKAYLFLAFIIFTKEIVKNRHQEPSK